MIELLLDWDLSLFHLINEAHHPFWDAVMYYLSAKWTWIPAYAFCLYWVYQKEGLKQIWIFLACIVLLIALSDQLSAGLMKPFFKRWRPCRVEADLEIAVHIVRGHCGGKYGFVSSHAANFFALATFLAAYFQKKKITWILFACAILVAYSRIYLGVHYPGDVTAGAILGSLIGLVVWKLFRFVKNKASNQ